MKFIPIITRLIPVAILIAIIIYDIKDSPLFGISPVSIVAGFALSMYALLGDKKVWNLKTKHKGALALLRILIAIVGLLVIMRVIVGIFVLFCVAYCTL